MGSLVGLLYLLAGITGAVAVVLLVRVLRSFLAPGGRRWQVRSGGDRRQRRVHVAVDRRRQGRRGEDHAREFLRQIEDQRRREARLSAAPRSVGSLGTP